jgi:hypothetical protein
MGGAFGKGMRSPESWLERHKVLDYGKRLERDMRGSESWLERHKA